MITKKNHLGGKKIIIFLIIYFLFGIENSFSYEYFENIGGYEGKIFKIEQNSTHKVIVSFSEKGESLKKLIDNVGGEAGINGAYFCPKDYSECSGKNYSNSDRISNGNISSKWQNTGIRYIFGFDKNNNPLIHQSSNIHKDNFSGIYNGISNFPLILKEGKSFLYKYEISIDPKMKSLGPKNFICSTKSGDIYMGYLNHMTIYSMVNALKNIGCYNALNLDSGGSLSIYNNGGYIKTPGRDIMDAFVIVKNKEITDKLDKKISDVSKVLINYLNKKKNKTIIKNNFISKLNIILKKNLTSKQRYLINGIIINLEFYN